MLLRCENLSDRPKVSRPTRVETLISLSYRCSIREAFRASSHLQSVETVSCVYSINSTVRASEDALLALPCPAPQRLGRTSIINTSSEPAANTLFRIRGGDGRKGET